MPLTQGSARPTQACCREGQWLGAAVVWEHCQDWWRARGLWGAPEPVC
jgi:hypothetical protein